MIEEEHEGEQLSQEEIVARIKEIIKAAKVRYNNLFRMIKCGNIRLDEFMINSLIKKHRGRGEDVPDDLLKVQEECRRFSDDLSAEVSSAGMASDESERFFNIDIAPDNATIGDLRFLQQYLLKIEKIFNGMVARGRSEEEIKG